jgi:hypothetical protein
MPLRDWLDFSAFYAAGSLAFTAEVTDLDAIVLFQRDLGLPITPWVYPAGLALLYVPFAWLPYEVAAALNVALEAGALALAAWIGGPLLGISRRWALAATFAWAPAAAGVVSGQNVGLALLLVVLGRGRWSGSAMAGGLFVGVLPTSRSSPYPHRHAPVASGLAGGAGLRGSSASTTCSALQPRAGPGLAARLAGNPPRPAARTSGERLAGHRCRPSPAIAAVVGGAGESGAFSPLVLAGYAIGLVYVAASLRALRAWGVAAAFALAAAVGLVVSPHAWIYDATLLLPALGVFAVAAGRRGWPWQDRWLLAAAYGTVLLWPLGGFIGVATPLVVALLAPAVLLGWGPLRRFGASPPG